MKRWDNEFYPQSCHSLVLLAGGTCLSRASVPCQTPCVCLHMANPLMASCDRSMQVPMPEKLVSTCAPALRFQHACMCASPLLEHAPPTLWCTSQSARVPPTHSCASCAGVRQAKLPAGHLAPWATITLKCALAARWQGVQASHLWQVVATAWGKGVPAAPHFAVEQADTQCNARQFLDLR